jgi:hypothetical protein
MIDRKQKDPAEHAARQRRLAANFTEYLEEMKEFEADRDKIMDLPTGVRMALYYAQELFQEKARYYEDCAGKNDVMLTQKNSNNGGM